MLAVLAVHAGQEQWTLDVDKALAKAKAEKKILFLNFTSTDGHPTVAKFNKEILGQDKFCAYARDNAVILVDIIMGTKKLKNPAMAKQHAATVKRYGVKKCPLVIVTDSAGQPLGELEYAAGGPGPFLAKLDELVKKAGGK
jgi:thioredoxin-related protein